MHPGAVGDRQCGLRDLGVEPHPQDRGQQERARLHLVGGIERLGRGHEGLAGLLDADAPPDDLDLVHARIVQVTLRWSPAERRGKERQQRLVVGRHATQRPTAHPMLGDCRAQDGHDLGVALGRRCKGVKVLPAARVGKGGLQHIAGGLEDGWFLQRGLARQHGVLCAQ